MPFRSGLPSGVRGPLYADAACGAGARGAVAPRPRCADAGVNPNVSKTAAVAPTVAITGLFIMIGSGRESDEQRRVYLRTFQSWNVPDAHKEREL
jgi:hypothetical protein